MCAYMSQTVLRCDGGGEGGKKNFFAHRISFYSHPFLLLLAGGWGVHISSSTFPPCAPKVAGISLKRKGWLVSAVEEERN